MAEAATRSEGRPLRALPPLSGAWNGSYTHFHFKARTICAVATFFDGYDFLAIA